MQENTEVMDEGNASRIQLQTFDRLQGWQTLETFESHLDAEDRQREIEESNVEQGLDVKMRVWEDS